MTLTLPDAAEIDSFLDSVFGVVDAGTETRSLLDSIVEQAPTELRRLDIPDVRDAMHHLDRARVQPSFGELDECKYAHPTTGRPSCIVGHILSYLAPMYFAWVSQSTGGVHSLNAIDQLFTARAVELLRRMQYHADSKRTWGEAFLEASLDQLEAVAV